MSKDFELICKMSAKTLKHYLAAKLQETHTEIYKEDGYVYAQGTMPVLLVAHMDTVHKEVPISIFYDSTKKAYMSPQGIGGDDRCGVYMILEIIKRYNCSVLFCEDEEIGAVGAIKFTNSELVKDLEFNYMIEFDRKGKNDAVFYDCDNPEFENFITEEFYESSWGTFSDISELAPVLGCAAVNLSCGYYNAHTVKEYVVFSEMEDSIEAACRILDRTTDDDKFEYIEKEYTYLTESYGYSSYRYSGDNLYYLFEYEDEYGKTSWYETEAYNESEAVGNLLMAHPHITYAHIIDMFVDELMYY